MTSCGRVAAVQLRRTCVAGYDRSMIASTNCVWPAPGPMPGMTWDEWISSPPVNHPEPAPAPAPAPAAPTTPLPGSQDVARGWDPALGASQLG